MEPASSIIQAFGGHRAVAEIVGCHRTRPYMWEKPKSERGSDGVIPNAPITKLLKYARENGIPIGPEDFFPLDVSNEAPKAKGGS